MSLNSATNQILWNAPDISVKFAQKIKIVDFLVVLLLGTAGIPPPSPRNFVGIEYPLICFKILNCTEFLENYKQL